MKGLARTIGIGTFAIAGMLLLLELIDMEADGLVRSVEQVFDVQRDSLLAVAQHLVVSVDYAEAITSFLITGEELITSVIACTK